MKKTILCMLVSLLSIQLTMAKDVITKDAARLPQASQEFIKEHFSGEKISYIKVDEELLDTTYDVIFISGIELEFMKNGEWKEIDAKQNAVPEKIIPANIQEYIRAQFEDTFITQIEKKKFHYEVELSNNLDLEFDKKGNFLRIDD